jgi:cbb3-type cytochrome oxidase subunit 3
MIWTLITGATWVLVALTLVLVAVVVWKMGENYEQE